MELKVVDVVIIGAGPSGCACALALKDSGLSVALFDNKTFPRDKICGDAIPGRAIKTLRNISESFAEEFKSFAQKYKTGKTRVTYNKESLDFNWVGEAYTCARIDFDNFLFSLVKKHSKTETFLNADIKDVAIEKNKIFLKEKKSDINFEAKIIIGADGAQSVIAKQLANRTIDRKHHAGSVRAYYSNVSNLESNTTEVYFYKNTLPGYLWIFPLPDNKANVGFGMLSSKIASKNLNLRKTFYNVIAEHPELSERFKNAKQISDLQGFGLPLGSRRVKISGDRFMLVGDAASLIDPISGDGIGNAMLSGKLAADQVIECFKTNNFTKNTIQQYDDNLFKILGKELKSRYRAQKILGTMPFILDAIFLLTKIKLLKKFIQKKL